MPDHGFASNSLPHALILATFPKHPSPKTSDSEASIHRDPTEGSEGVKHIRRWRERSSTIHHRRLVVGVPVQLKELFQRVASHPRRSCCSRRRSGGALRLGGGRQEPPPEQPVQEHRPRFGRSLGLSEGFLGLFARSAGQRGLGPWAFQLGKARRVRPS